ncbi:MAG: asparagine synthetase B [Planctomycetota bacterium]|nr:MAG: asparagine synthetase B [Planctomycetota bacterium]
MQRVVTAMRDTLTHRGPDDAGVWLSKDGRCALAHRRLSIVDLSERGRQPMVTNDGEVGLTFNGEIYNFAELRDDLAARGYDFESDSDAEVLLYLFASSQPNNLSRVEGMYAFATYNSSTGRLFLARDPFGKKPLYIAHGNGFTAFASELQAFRQIPGFDDSLSQKAIAEYLLLQYVHAPRTIYERCEKLEPGSWTSFEVGQGAPRRHSGRHWRFEATGSHETRTPYRHLGQGRLDELADELRPIVLAAVERRLMSDVPLGAFLSGGIDSALVAAMVTRELGMPLKTFSIGFEGTDESEHLLAREASGLLGTEHFEKMLDPNALDLLPQLAAHLDEPLGDSSCLPTFLLSQFTREHVTVALSGDGGDELFGGYGRYRETLREEGDWKMRALWLLRRRQPWRAGRAYCSGRWLMFEPDGVASLAGAAAGAHAESMVSNWSSTLDDNSHPLMHHMRALDAATYMPGAVLAKVDRMSMAHALEVRCPLLDRSVADFARGLSAEACFNDDLLKPVLRTLAHRYLPEEYIKRRKMGFGLPGKAWTQSAVLEQCDAVLLAPDAAIPDLLGADGLQRFVAHQRQEGCFSIYQVWTVLMLEHWLRAHRSAPALEPAL